MLVPWSGHTPSGWTDMEADAADRYVLSASSPLLRDVEGRREVRCCIRDCGHWLPARRRGVPNEYCREHHISVSTSPTYVYRDAKSNFIVAAGELDGLEKVERWRLGNESSEDALSWNLFVSLLHLGLLDTALPVLGVYGVPHLYLWGNRIAEPPEFWPRLRSVRGVLENGAGFPTEPDIIVHVPGRLLLLIEAKFGSPNGTLVGKEDRFGSVDDFLARYPSAEGVTDPLNRQWIAEQEPEHVLEQLCRNVILATHLAAKGERMVVANLVRADAEVKVEAEFRRHLMPDSPVEFRRLTWESFWPILAAHGEDAAPVRTYLANKTLRLRRAFPSLPLP